MKHMKCLLILGLVLGLAFVSISIFTGPRQAPASPIEAASARAPDKQMHAAKAERASAQSQQHALRDLMAGESFTLVADGRAQRFTLSLNEVYLTKAATHERLRVIEMQPDAQHLQQQAEKLGGRDAGWVLYPVGRDRNVDSRQILHRRILIQTKDRADTLRALKTHGLTLLSEPDYAPGNMIVEPVSGGPESTLRALSQLSAEVSISSVGPLLLRQLKKHLMPNDPFFGEQWHLKNTGQGKGKVGSDMKVTSVWDTYRGSGVRIAIVDDGLDLLHPDLVVNVDTANHYDWNGGDTNPTPNPEAEDFHGTSVGGVAAARGNNGSGVSGVAPEATLVGFRLISSSTDDSQDADALDRGKDIISIKNNSWGFGADASEMQALGPLAEASRENAVLTGRGGLGTLFVWAAGNGRGEGKQGQKDGSTNSIYNITVGATNNKGELSFYSETGPHITVVAPSSGGTKGVFTTDLTGAVGYNSRGAVEKEPADLNYTNSFGGTSSATPAVAGLLALMLEAKPSLNWRDAKEILLRSSTKLFPTGVGWVSRAGYQPGLLPIKHHQSYGGGQTDAETAVKMAESWTSLGDMVSSQLDWSGSETIPDNNKVGASIDFDFSEISALRVENLQLRLTASHFYRGDLEVTLKSPSGVISTLATRTGADSGSDYSDWIFSSIRHWGESGAGLWKLTVKDLAAGGAGFLSAASLILYGTQAVAPAITGQTTGNILQAEGTELALNLQVTGSPLGFGWKQNGLPLLVSSNPLRYDPCLITHAGVYQGSVSNVAGSQVANSVTVAIVKRELPAKTINVTSPLSLKVETRGSGLSYEWHFGAAALSNDTRISGATSPTLTIKNMGPDDQGTYTCIVRMENVAESIETLPVMITVREKATVVGPISYLGIVSGDVDMQFSAVNEVTSYKISSLPPGLVFDKTTGRLTGILTRPGSYKFFITAVNLAGTSLSHQVILQGQEFPLLARGTWSGLVARDVAMNGNLGGRLQLSVSSLGTYSGSLTLGAKMHSLSGRVAASIGSLTPTNTFSIRRGLNVSPLTGSFTMNLSSGTLSGQVDDANIVGSAALTATRNAWSSSNKPVLVTTSYNAALELPNALLANALYPQGHGHTTYKLTTSGGVSWAGRMADSTSFSGSAYLGPIGQIFMHGLLYTSTGSAQGLSTITLASGMVDGELSWLKNRQSDRSTTRSYKLGIPLHTLAVKGAKYSKPSAGTMIIGLDPILPPTLTDNAKLSFAGLPLTAQLNQLLHVTTANAAKVPTAISLNPQSVRLTLNATTGVLTGSFGFKDSDVFDTLPPIASISRSAVFSGLIITRPDLTRGVGHFNLAELPDTLGEKSSATPIVSGKMGFTSP